MWRKSRVNSDYGRGRGKKTKMRISDNERERSPLSLLSFPDGLASRIRKIEISYPPVKIAISRVARLVRSPVVLRLNLTAIERGIADNCSKIWFLLSVRGTSNPDVRFLGLRLRKKNYGALSVVHTESFSTVLRNALRPRRERRCWTGKHARSQTIRRNRPRLIVLDEEDGKKPKERISHDCLIIARYTLRRAQSLLLIAVKILMVFVVRCTQADEGKLSAFPYSDSLRDGTTVTLRAISVTTHGSRTRIHRTSSVLFLSFFII